MRKTLIVMVAVAAMVAGGAASALCLKTNQTGSETYRLYFDYIGDVVKCGVEYDCGTGLVSPGKSCRFFAGGYSVPVLGGSLRRGNGGVVTGTVDTTAGQISILNSTECGDECWTGAAVFGGYGFNFNAARAQ